MLWLGAGSLAVWVWLVLFRGGFWRMRAARLPVEASAAAVAAIVPARNEVEFIGRSAASLFAQRYGGTLDIFIVDDHSADGTAGKARTAAPGITVVQARPLPAGWTGKLWAVSEGLDRALARDPAFVLLTDADIAHAPDALAGLVAQAETGGFDLVSLMVRLHCGSMAERALTPAFVFFFLKLYPPRWIANPNRRTAGAAGGSILIRTAALRRIGGIAAIRGALIDDCALARAVKRTGGRVWLGLAGESASVRPYAGARGIWDMIARTAFVQLRHSAGLLALTVAGMAAIYLAPPALAIAGSGPPRWLGLAAWVMMTAAYLPAVRFYGLSPLWALSLPAAACFYSAATIHSAMRYWLGRGGEWKGRVQDARDSEVLR